MTNNWRVPPPRTKGVDWPLVNVFMIGAIIIGILLFIGYHVKV